MVRVSKKPISKITEKEELTKKTLEKMKHLSEEERAAAIAREFNLYYIDLNLFPVSGDEMRSIPEKDAFRYGVAVFHKAGKNVRVAITNPADPKTLSYIQKIQKENGWNVRLYVVSPSSLEKVLNKLKEAPLIDSLESFRVSLTGKDLEEFEKKFKGLLDLKKRIREIPTTDVISAIMAGAVKMKASDIHFEAQEKQVRLRYRIDGVLQDIGNIPSDVYRFVLSRIKMMGKMKINIRDIAQDGQFSVDLEDGKINVRVSVIPGKQGENTVMRLLSQSDVLLDVEDLGLRGLAYEEVQKQVAKPNGMILNTGPTGSGKTTTLYALVNKINKPGIKIITIEDPVEYEVEGISQTQVASNRGYTFSRGLRAIVRQDPDVVLVGEIRDDETADIALNAALTGHLVLSTIHTNSAAGSIPRLIELGIRPNLIGPAVNALIAQRLVRRLCPNCKETYKPAKETVDSVKKVLSLISPKAKLDIPKKITQFYRTKGCPRCHNLGYQGRVGIFEVLTVNEPIEKLILDMASEDEITQAALEEGMTTMAQDGILKAIEGITSLEEIFRVTGQTEFLEGIYEKLMAQALSRSITVADGDLKIVDKHISSFEKLSKLIRKANQKDFIRYILASGLLLKAGDVHIEPEEKEVTIRLRIDGILQNIGSIPLNEYPSLLGEIKILCGLKAEVRQGVKDSRFSIELEKPFGDLKELKTDVRISIILGGFGETVVMRLLNQSAVVLDIDKLGIRKGNLDKILTEIEKPNGLFLNTGPTGSGKTTTLYSLLRILNKPEVKIITVEDPIEYQMKGILQTQVNDKDGYTFPTALRSILRQNPDIVMIGEIRDDETAKIAIQAALTGHLVLSTIHTNDAAGAVSRLLNMGIKPEDLATASNGFMAQRLVRKLCSCKKKVKPSPEDKKKLEEILKSISKKTGAEAPKRVTGVYEPQGCDKCNGIGYKGRTTVSEALIVDRDIEDLINSGALSSKIMDKAFEKGMLTMAQDGVIKVVEGETTLEEVRRVTEE